MHRWLTHSVLAAASLAAGLAAQAPLELEFRGGSLPGDFELQLSPSLFPFEPCLLFLGLEPGPTPLSLVSPNDPRSLDVGANSVVSYFGTFDLNGEFGVGPNPVPGDPALVDVRLFAQAVTFGGQFLVDRISNPASVRMGLSGTFRDRGVVTTEERAFGTMIPRQDGRWMIVGGGRGGLLAQTAHATSEIYDDVSDSFVPGPTMATERSLHVATELPDGRWLLTGGVNFNNDPQDICEIYDPATDAFTVVAPMSSPRMGHTATLLPDGRVFVAGGLDAITVGPLGYEAIFDIVASTEIYDPATDTWAPTVGMSTPRAGHIAILRPDGNVLLAGGISWDTIFLIQLPAVRSSCDVYNPVANQMAGGPGMSTAHSLVSPVPLGNDRWLVAGGTASMSLASLGTPTAVAEIYDANANTWSPAGSMATPRANQLIIELGGGQFLAVGGANGSVLSPMALSSGETYDANTNSWGPGPSLTVERAAPGGLLTPRGQFHIVGGSSTLGQITRSCEWFYF